MPQSLIKNGEQITAADLRELLKRARLSQRQAARELQISDRLMRFYCAGGEVIPSKIYLALVGLACLEEHTVRCPVMTRVFKEAPDIGCVLPAHHEGPHQAPFPLEE